MDILLSGVLGSLLAILISIGYQSYTEYKRKKEYLLIKITEWLDSISFRMHKLHEIKNMRLVYKCEASSSDEWKKLLSELIESICSRSILEQIKYHFGDDSDLLKDFTGIRATVGPLVEKLLRAEVENWDKTKKQFDDIIREKIEPLMQNVSKKLVPGRYFSKLYYSVRELISIN